MTMSDKSYKSASNGHINRYKMAHMIGVAEYMRERAEDYALDPDAMYVVGLLHDIGYLGGREGHEQRGADILFDLDMGEDVVSAIENHGKNLYELRDEDSEAITPELVLLVEADMSVDARGYRVGFEGRLADIGRRYTTGSRYSCPKGTTRGRSSEDNRGEDHIAYKTVQDNIRFIKEYQKEKGIGKPVKLYHNKGEER